MLHDWLVVNPPVYVCPGHPFKSTIVLVCCPFAQVVQAVGCQLDVHVVIGTQVPDWHVYPLEQEGLHPTEEHEFVDIMQELHVKLPELNP